MKTIASVSLLLFFSVAAPASTETMHVSAGAQLRVTGTNATAAYSIDTDCAEVEVDAGVLVVTGKRPCATHIVMVTADTLIEREVFVSPRPAQLDRLREARMLERGIHESGYISTSYSSDPGQVETTLSVARTQGDRTAGMSISVADGYAFSPDRRRAAIPLASLRFSSPSSSVTLMDSFVEQSPLTIAGTDLRGLHVQSGPWFLHAGIASLTNFRQRVFDPNPDRTVDTGYRFTLTPRSGITGSAQWIHASSLYASGRSGVIGSAMYDYQDPERLRFRLEVGLNRKVATAASFDYIGENNRLQLRMRSTPLSFPGLSAAPARGFQGNGSWTHQLAASLTLDLSASRDTYSLLDGTSQSNTYEGTQLQWRLNRFTLSGGLNHAELSRRNAAAIISNSVPVGLAFDSQHFGNSIQYQFRRNANDTGSYLLRDSLRINSGPVRLTIYAGRQTQAPTLDYVVTNVPGLRQALLTAGVTATTPEEILDFIRSHASLIGGGFITNLSLNLAPVRTEYGTDFKWMVHRNLLSMDAGYRVMDDQRIVGHVVSRVAMVSASIHLTRTTTLDLTGSMLETHAPGSVLRSPLLAVGLRQKIGNVPDFLNHFQQHGWIKGMVFEQEDGHVGAGIAGVTVVLDGVQRVRTNNSGFYYFHSVPEGRHSVEIQYQSTSPYIFTSAPQVDTAENTVVNFGIRARKALLFGTIRNDAGMPINKAVILLEGTQQEQARTAENGSYSFNLDHAGTYTVTIDPQSLPPAYDLTSVSPQTVKLEVNEPARTDFVVRALRSVYGSINCAGAPAEGHQLFLHLDNDQSPVAVDQNGNYKIGDLPSGWHEFTISYGSIRITRRIELSAEPANLEVNFEVCAGDASTQLQNSVSGPGA